MLSGQSYLVIPSLYTAQRKVSKLLLDDVANLLYGERPSLVVGQRLLWRVPIWLRLPIQNDKTLRPRRVLKTLRGFSVLEGSRSAECIPHSYQSTVTGSPVRPSAWAAGRPVRGG